MKTRSLVRIVAVLALAVAATGFSADAPATQPRIDPAIDKQLHAMSDLVAGAKTLSFECYAISEQVLPSGQKVEFARNQKVSLRRPDAVIATVVGDNENLQFIYDGKTVTCSNAKAKVYAQTAAPATIDDTLDMLALKYGMVMPLADMIFSDPYKALASQVRTGQDLGVGYVFQTKCRHLAFRQESVDWQIWLEDGPKPWPRKLVITYKETPAQLQYTAYFHDWTPDAAFPADALKFVPPTGVTKIDFTGPTTQPAVDKR
jgi:hypothetical protein